MLRRELPIVAVWNRKLVGTWHIGVGFSGVINNGEPSLVVAIGTPTEPLPEGSETAI